MAEVRELDSRRRAVFPDCFSPGDLFLEETVNEDEVVFRRIRPSKLPLTEVVREEGVVMIQAPLDREKLRKAIREERDAR